MTAEHKPIHTIHKQIENNMRYHGPKTTAMVAKYLEDTNISRQAIRNYILFDTISEDQEEFNYVRSYFWLDEYSAISDIPLFSYIWDISEIEFDSLYQRELIIILSSKLKGTGIQLTKREYSELYSLYEKLYERFERYLVIKNDYHDIQESQIGLFTICILLKSILDNSERHYQTSHELLSNYLNGYSRLFIDFWQRGWKYQFSTSMSQLSDLVISSIRSTNFQLTDYEANRNYNFKYAVKWTEKNLLNKEIKVEDAVMINFLLMRNLVPSKYEGKIRNFSGFISNTGREDLVPVEKIYNNYVDLMSWASSEIKKINPHDSLYAYRFVATFMVLYDNLHPHYEANSRTSFIIANVFLMKIGLDEVISAGSGKEYSETAYEAFSQANRPENKIDISLINSKDIDGVVSWIHKYLVNKEVYHFPEISIREESYTKSDEIINTYNKEISEFIELRKKYGKKLISEVNINSMKELNQFLSYLFMSSNNELVSVNNVLKIIQQSIHLSIEEEIKNQFNFEDLVLKYKQKEPSERNFIDFVSSICERLYKLGIITCQIKGIDLFGGLVPFSETSKVYDLKVGNKNLLCTTQGYGEWGNLYTAISDINNRMNEYIEQWLIIDVGGTSIKSCYTNFDRNCHVIIKESLQRDEYSDLEGTNLSTLRNEIENLADIVAEIVLKKIRKSVYGVYIIYNLQSINKTQLILKISSKIKMMGENIHLSIPRKYEVTDDVTLLSCNVKRGSIFLSLGSTVEFGFGKRDINSKRNT